MVRYRRFLSNQINQNQIDLSVFVFIFLKHRGHVALVSQHVICLSSMLSSGQSWLSLGLNWCVITRNFIFKENVWHFEASRAPPARPPMRKLANSSTWRMRTRCSSHRQVSTTCLNNVFCVKWKGIINTFWQRNCQCARVKWPRIAILIFFVVFVWKCCRRFFKNPIMWSRGGRRGVEGRSRGKFDSWSGQLCPLHHNGAPRWAPEIKKGPLIFWPPVLT